MQSREQLEAAIVRGPGHLENFVNHASNSKLDTTAKAIKSVINHAATAVKGPKLSVMLAGSRRRTEALQDADLDVYVQTYGDNVTKAQRREIAQLIVDGLKEVGYSYTAWLRESIVTLNPSASDYPRVDVAFERFGDQSRRPPRSGTKHQVVCKAVKFLKCIQEAYPLPKLSGTELGHFVERVYAKHGDRPAFGEVVLRCVRALGVSDSVPHTKLGNQAWINIAVPAATALRQVSMSRTRFACIGGENYRLLRGVDCFCSSKKR
ncbi:hypothetical protein WJX72_011102 [[Myrmecia] bisecta]|uniref:Polymerase nucleotidyl transferase domain-containing protein n=1 Tax=[Myrmecia] bisecta TaxID=41462 RepID=A0AAW1R9V9_9CHLO